MDIVLSPGSMSLAALLIGYFGVDRVTVGGWGQPCGLRGATQDEIDALMDLFREYDVTITEQS